MLMEKKVIATSQHILLRYLIFIILIFVGGRSIQHEMDDIRKTLKNRVLETGNAVTTTAGNLRNCSKIVHVAGPE